MIPTSPTRPSLSRSATDALGASVYGPLAYSGFGVRKPSLPAAVQLPQSVRDAVAEPIPKEYHFELELNTVKQWNQLQNRKYAEAEAEKKRLAAEEEAEARRKEEAERRRVEADRKREAAETEAAIERVANAEREAQRREEEALEAARQEMEENQKAASLAVLAAEEEGRRLEAESKRLRDLALQDKQQAKDPPPYIPNASPPAYSAAPPSYSAAPPAYSAANPFNDGPAAAEAKGTPSPSPGPYSAMAFPPEHAPKLQQMLSHTGANMGVCRKYLEESNYDVNQAINRYWDSQ